jgi:hypothetical protein
MGGKFFINKNGENPCERIQAAMVPDLISSSMGLLHRFFDTVEPVTCVDILPKENHGDLDFVVMTKPGERESFREYCKDMNIPIGSNGPMEHIAFPFSSNEIDRHVFQIDLIFSGKNNYETIKHFYSKNLTFNSTIGQFARSLGYIFSVNGFFLLVKDARKQNRKFLLTEDLEVSYKILQLPPFTNEQIFESPEAFAAWIMASPRFDTKSFLESHNTKSHRDARRENFCSKVYEILDNCGKKATIKFSHIDFTGEVDLNKALAFEIEILGKNIVENLLEKIKEYEEVASPIIRGETIIEMGYPEGPIIGKIIQDVSSYFDEETTEEEIKKYILGKYKIE